MGKIVHRQIRHRLFVKSESVFETEHDNVIIYKEDLLMNKAELVAAVAEKTGLQRKMRNWL